MNKTIIININGIVFHIEEDAYEVLKHYMTDVKRHFINSEDSHEITTDIENRIAEMFNEILTRDNKQVIVELDVKSVIEQMGTVEDFEHAEDGSQIAGPANTFTYKTERRRLFRDPDDHLISGVCAGIANYFDVEPLWIRLAFGISALFFATGLFLYVILWIIVPKALSRADRMAMKGEKLDLQGFKKNFEDELNAVRGHVNTLHQEAKPFVYKSRDFVSDFFQHFANFLSGAGRLFLKFFGICILLACFGACVALIISSVAFFAFGKMEIMRMFPFSIIIDHQYNVLFFVSAFLLLALPLMGVILLTIRMIFNKDTLNRSTGFSMLIVWIGALCVVIYFGARVAADFRSEGRLSQTVNIKPTANNTYHLKLNQARYLSPEDSIELNIRGGQFGGKVILDGDNNNDDFDGNTSPNNVRIRIERSDIAQPILEESFTARGRNLADALMNARYTSYQFKQLDSILRFDRHLTKPLGRPWRNQDVTLTLKLPLNAIVVIDDNLDHYLDGVDIYQCKEVNKQPNATIAKFIMTDAGLQCKVDTLVIAQLPANNTPQQ